MNAKIISFLVIALCSTFFNATFAQNIDKNYFDGELYIKVKQNTYSTYVDQKSGSIAQNRVNFIVPYLSKYQVRKIEMPFWFDPSDDLQRVFRVYFDQPQLVDSFLKDLTRLPELEYAEKIPYDQVELSPNDLGANTTSGQWALWKINAQQAWDITQGSPSIVVAVVDNAIQTTHPDLIGNCLTGYDIADNDSDPNPPNTNFSHGTHVSGIVSAKTNNGTGIASIGYNTKILPVKATNNSASYNSITHGYQGIAWAANNGARVINCSWGGPSYSATNETAITTIVNRGIIVVASAGNSNNSSYNYPAAYTKAISVACTNINDNKSSFSTYGTWVDISAPGESINSCVPTNSYGIKSGTSMSAPLVAGLCGLMLSVNPSMTPTQVESCLRSTAVNINAINPSYSGLLGAGRINAYQAVLCAQASGGCAASHNFTAPISGTQDYESQSHITASGSCQISNTARVRFDATTYVLLSPNFNTQSGAVFEALIDGCGGIYTFSDIAVGGTTDSLFNTSTKPIFATVELITKSNTPTINANKTSNEVNYAIYPNPTQSTTTITYTLPQTSDISLTIHDLTGREISRLADNQTQTEGNYSFAFDATDLPSGIYICTLRAGDTIKTQKLVVTK